MNSLRCNFMLVLGIVLWLFFLPICYHFLFFFVILNPEAIVSDLDLVVRDFVELWDVREMVVDAAVNSFVGAD